MIIRYIVYCSSLLCFFSQTAWLIKLGNYSIASCCFCCLILLDASFWFPSLFLMRTNDRRQFLIPIPGRHQAVRITGMSTSSAPDQASGVAPETLPSGKGKMGSVTVMHHYYHYQHIVMHCSSSGSGMEAAAQLPSSSLRRRPPATGWGIAARILMMSCWLLPCWHLQPAECVDNR